jgi:hypothetical protein
MPVPAAPAAGRSTTGIWSISTCRDADRMEAFAVGDGNNTGTPVFATNTAVLEFHEAYDQGDDDPFAIHLWKELIESRQV